ncbi:3-oxoacyl-ACP synthase, partial [bacterium]|nr:3-oxoacyl-ACP synthase [bacterium]
MSGIKRSEIVGTGSAVPEGILTNRDFEKIVETNDEWIVSRSGIRERHVTDDQTATSDLASLAARRAL